MSTSFWTATVWSSRSKSNWANLYFLLLACLSSHDWKTKPFMHHRPRVVDSGCLSLCRKVSPDL